MHIEYLDLGDLTGPPINLEDITRVNVLRAYAKSPTKKMLPNLRSIGAYCGEHDVTALQFLADVPEVNGHEITHYETELRRERLQAVAKRALEGPGFAEHESLARLRYDALHRRVGLLPVWQRGDIGRE